MVSISIVTPARTLWRRCHGEARTPATKTVCAVQNRFRAHEERRKCSSSDTMHQDDLLSGTHLRGGSASVNVSRQQQTPGTHSHCGLKIGKTTASLFRLPRAPPKRCVLAGFLHSQIIASYRNEQRRRTPAQKWRLNDHAVWHKALLEREKTRTCTRQRLFCATDLLNVKHSGNILELEQRHSTTV